MKPTSVHTTQRLLAIMALLAALPLAALAKDGEKEAAAAAESLASSFKANDDSEDSKTGELQKRGSDEASASFQKSVLPPMLKMLDSKLGESRKVDDSTMRLDPSKLKLATDSDVRVYFVGEGAGYQNTLGYNLLDARGNVDSRALIFANASSNVSYLSSSGKDDAQRTKSAPLLPGDFVDLGKFKAGSMLDFFMIADGASGGKNVYTANAATNPDKLNHMVAFASEGSSYLLFGFEDLFGGGDRDFNDLLFAVEIGASNVASLIATPEPAGWLTMAGLLGCVMSSATRLRKNKLTALFA